MKAELKIKITFSQLMEGLDQLFGRQNPDIDPAELCIADAEKLEAYARIIRMLLKEKP